MKQQDPMNPMDNSQMLAQQAQFTQISEMQKLNSALNSNNMIMQANSLVGKTVQIVDPDNTSRLITGVVTSANFTNDSATVTVNGKDYPLGLVASVTDGAPASSDDVINNKKLSELNNASITAGVVTVMVTDNSNKTTNKIIEITDKMTVADLRQKFADIGLETEIKDGTLVVKKGSNKTINMSNGNVENSLDLASNFVGSTKMYVESGTGYLVTGILDFNRTK
jgi:flagellar basal-body rod modification protein FlgD